MPDPTFTAPPTNPSRSDAPAVFITRADAFVAWFSTLYTELGAFVTWVGLKIAEIAEAVSDFTETAEAAETNLNTIVSDADAAFDAKLALAGFKGTSTTSLAIGTGSKSLTVQTALSFAAGGFVTIADAAAPTNNFMFGQVTSYNQGTGALVVQVTSAFGTGTFTAWSVSLSGPPATIPYATAAEVRAGTVSDKSVSPSILAAAQAFVDLGDITGNVTLDLRAFIKVKARLVGNVTFLTPSNIWNGFDGILQLTQDATGSRTAAFSTDFKKTGAITLSTAANSVDAFSLCSDGTNVKISPPLKAFV